MIRGRGEVSRGTLLFLLLVEQRRSPRANKNGRELNESSKHQMSLETPLRSLIKLNRKQIQRRKVRGPIPPSATLPPLKRVSPRFPLHICLVTNLIRRTPVAESNSPAHTSPIERFNLIHGLFIDHLTSRPIHTLINETLVGRLSSRIARAV